MTDPAIQELINRQDELEGRQEAILHRVQPVLEYAEPIARAEAKKRQREAVEREIEGEGKVVVEKRGKHKSASVQGSLPATITAAYAVYLTATADPFNIELFAVSVTAFISSLRALYGAWRREDLT